MKRVLMFAMLSLAATPLTGCGLLIPLGIVAVEAAAPALVEDAVEAVEKPRPPAPVPTPAPAPAPEGKP